MGTNTNDNEAPKVGSRLIRVMDLTDTSFTIVWEKATDNFTDSDNIRYKVGIIEYENYDDTFHVVADELGIHTFTFTDLKPKTKYGLYVEAYDEAGNKCQYPEDNGYMIVTTADTKSNSNDVEAPRVSSKSIKVSDITKNSITISWERAMDNVTAASKIRYYVLLCGEKDDGWTMIKDGETGISSCTFTNLKPNTKYSFYVEAIDEAGNRCHYPGDKEFETATTIAENNTNATLVNRLSILMDQQASVLLGTDSILCILEYTYIKRNSSGRIVATGTQSLKYYWSSKKKKSDVIQLPEGCDFEKNELTLTLMSRRGAVTGLNKWKTCCSGNIDVSGDTLKIKIVGSYYNYDLHLGGTANEGYAQFKNTPTGSTGQTGQPSTGSTPRPTDAERRQKIRDFFREQSNRDTLENVTVSTATTDKDKEYIVSGGQAMMLMNKKFDIDNPCNEFMPIDESSIYPGRLIYANRDLIDGKPSDVKFYVPDEVGKVTVTVNFIGSGKSSSEPGVIATPSKIQEAIEKILTRLLATGALPPASVDTNTYLKNSKESIAVDAGCSVDYMGAKCKIDTTTTKNQESFYKVEQFKQGFYQVSVEPEDNDDVNFLGTGVTIDTLRKAREKGPLAIIKCVTYGRVGYNVKKYDASSFTFKGDESASYEKYVTVTSKQDISKNSSASSHYARVWGGSAKTAGSALLAGRTAYNEADSKKLDNDFTSKMAEKMEISMQNQGVPISFTVAFLASGRPVGTRLTGSYVESDYIPLVNSLSMSIKNEATTLGGTNSVRCFFEWEYIKLDSRGNIIEVGKGDDHWDWDCKKTRSVNIELPERCYFKENKIKLTLQTRLAASLGLNKWKTSNYGLLNVSGGHLDICLGGDYKYNDLYLKGDENDKNAKFM